MSKSARFHRAVVLLLALGLPVASPLASAQQDPDQTPSLRASEIQQLQRGSIEALAQDDGYITISGVNYLYDASCRVVVDGVSVPVSAINEGMVVRFLATATGQLSYIDIIGPVDKIRELINN